MRPQTQYVKKGDASIAYQVVGEGPIDLVYVTGLMSHVDVRWDYPPGARFLDRLASFGRLIMFDRLGTGASDRLPPDALPVWEDWTEDLRLVLDCVGSERAAIVAQLDAGPWGMLFAATEPDRTAALILVNTAAKYAADEALSEDAQTTMTEAAVRLIEEHWGSASWAGIDPRLAADPEALAWVAKYQRASASPTVAAALFRHVLSEDARPILPAIRVPTLVLHHTANWFVPVELGRYLAANIAGARLVELAGAAWWEPFDDDADEIVIALEEFLTGMPARVPTNRILATLLFTDIVGSTQLIAGLGDQRWRGVLNRFRDLVRDGLRRRGGREINTTGDGFLAAFDGPTHAILCALEVVDTARSLGFEVRAGVHSGECERIGDDVAGITVHVCDRITNTAGAGEVWCSRTVRDLSAGGELRFVDRGAHLLKGVPDEWNLYQVEPGPRSRP